MDNQQLIQDFYKSCGAKTPEQMHTYAENSCQIGKIKDCKFYRIVDGKPKCGRGWCLAK